MQKIVKYVRFFVHPSTTTKIPVFQSLSPTISFRTVFFVPFVHNSSFYSSFSFDTLTKLPTKGGAGFPSFLRILSKLNYYFLSRSIPLWCFLFPFFPSLSLRLCSLCFFVQNLVYVSFRALARKLYNCHYCSRVFNDDGNLFYLKYFLFSISCQTLSL